MAARSLSFSVAILLASQLTGEAQLEELGMWDMPKLASLRTGCRLELPDPGGPLWLVCDPCRFALLGRGNLEGQVNIVDADQALEFVRLFTSANTWYLSAVDRMIEVRRGPKASRSHFVVTTSEFAECCVAPEVKEAEESSEGNRWFVVQRTVVEWGTYRVYVLTEVVGQNGRVVTRERELLEADGNELGEFLLPFTM